MKVRKTITRREFIRVSTMTAAGAVAVACGAKATEVPPTAVPPDCCAADRCAAHRRTRGGGALLRPPPYRPPPRRFPSTRKPPCWPSWSRRAELPPVDERLPKNPWVVASYEGIGKYGGNWRRCFQGVSDYWGPTKMVDRAWGWFDKDLNLIPRLLESWTVSPDGKEWTIKMREGLKWSDGKAEYTTDDLAFWYQYELQNKKLTAGLANGLERPGQDPREVRGGGQVHGQVHLRQTQAVLHLQHDPRRHGRRLDHRPAAVRAQPTI